LICVLVQEALSQFFWSGHALLRSLLLLRSSGLHCTSLAGESSFVLTLLWLRLLAILTNRLLSRPLRQAHDTCPPSSRLVHNILIAKYT
jgi:hypothetical protein